LDSIEFKRRNERAVKKKKEKGRKGEKEDG
jgi:hypothetical protein